jgi:hypothetical protein
VVKHSIPIIALLLFAGCSVDPDANPGQHCEETAECPLGRVCYRNYCVLGNPTDDGGPGDTGRVDTGFDGGPGIDATIPDTGPCTVGEPCSTGMPGICNPGLTTCDDQTPCVAVTSSKAEVCNLADDDCDGDIDEEWDLLTDERHCGACNDPCGTGLECCGGRCTNVATSTTHCGSCGFPCAGDTCCGGDCFDTTTSTTHCGACGESCGPNEICCGDRCADLQTDEEHCGACTGPDVACDNGELCCGGTCALPGSNECQGCLQTCPGGTDCCQGSCVDLTSNADYCGSCTNDCTGGTPQCCGGQCEANDVDHCNGCAPCAPGELCCSTGCEANDAANCRSCGNSCTAGQTCCPNNPAPMPACAFLQIDTLNCGGCGITCGTNQICDVGHCCNSNERWCDNTCRNLAEDDDNCGECGNRCRLLGILFSCNGGSCTL